MPRFRLGERGKSHIGVSSLSAARGAFEGAGATLYRGPLDIGNGQAVCQFADPFGNLIGVVGAADA